MFDANTAPRVRQREYDSRLVAKELIGGRVTMYVTDPKAHEGGFTVIAQVTGDYVKTGLPDPLELRFYFTPGIGLISQLIIVTSKHS